MREVVRSENLVENAGVIKEGFTLKEVIAGVDHLNLKTDLIKGDAAFDVPNSFKAEVSYPEHVAFISKRRVGETLVRCSVWKAERVSLGEKGAYRYSNPGIQIQALPVKCHPGVKGLSVGIFIDQNESAGEYRLLIPMFKHDCFVKLQKVFVSPWSIREGIEENGVKTSSWLDHLDGFITLSSMIAALKLFGAGDPYWEKRGLFKDDTIEAINTVLSDAKQLYPELFISED